MLRLCIYVAPLLFMKHSATPVAAADYFVSSAAEITTTLNSLAGPGDTLMMADGVWTNQTIHFSSNGTSASPITLRAQTPGKVILNGNSTLNISGDWLVVDGLRFEGGQLNDGSNAIVEFRGSNGEATNSRFTNSAIINYNAANVDARYHWLELFGQNNRVDSNRFEGQSHSGVTVVVRRDDASAQYHRIDRNHFVDRPAPISPASSNGFETIRIGTSHQSLSDSFTTVENNLFERTDGEIEIISNKSGNNTFQYNTFRDAEGTLTLRHGNNNLVAGNFFLGQNNSRSGAIRVIGEGQTIVNNYIANVDDRAGGAISISAGVDGSALNQYYQVKDAVIAHNTIAFTDGPMVKFDDGLGSSGRTLLAENVVVANNLFRSGGANIFEGSEGTGWTWQGNLAFGGGLGPKAGDPGITVADPLLQFQGDGLWRPTAASPVVDAAVGDYSNLITLDMDGQPRMAIYDIGADEVSTATIVRKPLGSGDVGPAWISDPVDPPGGGGCRDRGCAIQAEDFAALLDPNANGTTWTVHDDPDALGGQLLRAPSGDRVNRPGDPHDAVAVYDLTFSVAGQYRAYYRARGFDGSSDSIYVPTAFDVDPESSETLSSNGEFRWEVGQIFTISPSQVDVPLELRIGRRERLAELDAVVLDSTLNLSAEQLDALFDVSFAAGDFNEDGLVNDLDATIWQEHFGLSSGASHNDGDADADADVDGRDWVLWQRDANRPTPSPAHAVPEPGALVWLSLVALTKRRTLQPRTTPSAASAQQPNLPQDRAPAVTPQD